MLKQLLQDRIVTLSCIEMPFQQHVYKMQNCVEVLGIEAKSLQINYDAYMLLWQNAFIQLKQIDYINKSDIHVSKVLTYSSFLIVTAGGAQIVIDDQSYHVQRFSIFHLGKSQSLHIRAQQSVSYFLISYKGDVMYKDVFMQHLHMHYQPFQTHFSCVPANPIVIHSILQDMNSKWQSGSIQEHLSVRASFYELIYHVFRELIVFAEDAHQSAIEEIKAMGNYLGRQEEAKAFTKEFEDRIAKAKEKIMDVIPKGSTFTIYEMFEKNATIIGKSSVSGGRALYQILGMQPQEKVQELFDTKEGNNGRYEISYEVVGNYVGDYNFMINFFNKDGQLPATWTNLDVVKSNQVLELPSEYYFASDPLSGLHQAEELADKIVEFTKAHQQ